MRAAPLWLSIALSIAIVTPSSAFASPLSASSSRYAGFAAFRGPRVPGGARPVARLSRAPNDYVFLLPAGTKPDEGAPLLGDGPWVTGRILVELSGDAALEAQAREVAGEAGLAFVRTLSVGRWALFDVGEPNRIPETLRQLTKDARVTRAEAERLRRLDIRSPLDDELFPLQWHLENTAQRPLPRMTAGADINVRRAWNITTGDPDVIIAVIDTGHDAVHPDFADPGKVVAPLDTTDLSDDASPPPFENSAAHGIACAGLAAASRTGTEGTVGVCPDCGVMPIRVFDALGFTTDTAIVDAFVHARVNGASIASNSWGVGPEVIAGAVHDAIGAFVDEARGGRGGVVVFAIGNTSGEVQPSELAIDPRVLAVGGTGADDVRVAYSTFGPGLDLVAPTGHDFEYDEQGNVVLVGPQLVTTDRPGDDGYGPAFDDFLDPGLVGDPNYTATMSGTSGACPIVAGVAGLLLSARPDLEYEQVFSLLREHAAKVGPVSYDADGWHPEYGFGRVDAFASLRAAITGDVCAPSSERCDDGVDNDCDGNADALDEDCGFVLPGPVTDVGAACTWFDSTGCGEGFCWGFSTTGEGICALSCRAAACPEGSVCVSTDDAWGDYPLCFASCATDADCAEGASCLPTLEGPVCHPLCGEPDASICPDGMWCEVAGEPCVGDFTPPPPVPADAGPEPADAGPDVLDGGLGVGRKTDRLRIAPVVSCQAAGGMTSGALGMLGLLFALTRRNRRRGL